MPETEGYQDRGPVSPTTAVFNFLASKGQKPTSQAVRTVLDENARNPGYIPGLVNQAPPDPDGGRPGVPPAPQVNSAGAKGGPITFVPPIPPAGGAPTQTSNTSAPPTQDNSGIDPRLIASAAVLGIPIAALMASKFGNITQPNAPADTMQGDENPSDVAARRAAEANSAPPLTGVQPVPPELVRSPGGPTDPVINMPGLPPGPMPPPGGAVSQDQLTGVNPPRPDIGSTNPTGPTSAIPPPTDPAVSAAIDKATETATGAAPPPMSSVEARLRAQLGNPTNPTVVPPPEPNLPLRGAQGRTPADFSIRAPVRMPFRIHG